MHTDRAATGTASTWRRVASIIRITRSSRAGDSASGCGWGTRSPFGTGFYYGYPYYNPYYYDGYPPPGYGYPAPGEYPPASPPPSGAPSSGSSVIAQPGAAAGSVSFEITPATAEVFIDGEYVGRVSDLGPTTQPLALKPGRHRIEIRAPGYQTLSIDADVTAGQVIPYRGTLQREG